MKMNQVKQLTAAALVGVMLFSECMSGERVRAEETESAAETVSGTETAAETEVELEEAELNTGLRVEYEEPVELTGEEAAALEEDEETYSVYISTSAEYSYWMQFSNDYYCDQLSEAWQLVWDELETMCMDYLLGTDTSSTLRISENPLTDSDIESTTELYNFISMFKYAHPQFYFLQNTFGYAYSTTDSGTIYYPTLYVYDAFCDSDARTAATESFQTAIDEWLAEIETADVKTEEMEKAAVDLLCNKLTYASNDYDQSAYSAVCLNETVCAGYSAALQMLLNALGIETIEVTSENHGWNMVNIHGIWYHTDATWADQVSWVYYGYYNKSTETYSANDSHVAEDFWSEFLPEAVYDSCEEPYFENGNYTYFIVNNNSSLDSLLAGAIAASDGALYSEAPETVTEDETIYQTIQLLWDDSGSDDDDEEDVITKLEKAEDGDTVYAELSDSTELSAEILAALADLAAEGKDVTLEIILDTTAEDGGYSWKISSMDVSSESLENVDLSVSRSALDGTESDLQEMLKDRNAEQIAFGQSGSYGFTGALTLATSETAASWTPSGSKTSVTADKAVLLQISEDEADDGALKLTDSVLLSDGAMTFCVSNGADGAVVYGVNGDTDGDGAVALVDLMQILHQYSGRSELNQVQFGFADIDSSGKIELSDLMRELHYYSGRSNILYS